jgi:endonuclease G
MKTIHTLWVSVLLICANIALAQTVHISHCLRACPQVSDARNEVVVRHLYAASIMQNSGLAEWVAYRVLPDAVGVASLLGRWWQQDELLQTQNGLVDSDSGVDFVQPDLSNAQDRDYRLNEIRLTSEDRGRLAPMSSFAGTPYWDELNYLSNMAPIPQGLRLGSWSRLDQAVNELVASAGQLYVVSGPLYAGNGLRSDLEPSHFFKLITDGEQVAAFRFPVSTPVHADFCAYTSKLNQIESESGLALLPALDAADDIRLLELLNCHS